MVYFSLSLLGKAVLVALMNHRDEEHTYQIVGVDEADVKEGRISVLSPLARALIGKKTGDTAQVKSPKGEKEYEIKKFYFE